MARFGGTRGGGKRGGKGSLPRYLLDNKVPQKLMAEMMSKLLMFNFIRGRDVFKHAMMLFIEEYRSNINEHVRANYLDPCDPRKLGGRAAGIQGQVGSTNGLEKRGGIWQEQWKALRKNHSENDRDNFVIMLEGT